MRKNCFIWIAPVLLWAQLLTWPAGASADSYVAQNGQAPSPPYDSWNNAASNIQAAVDAAPAGGTIWVASGCYTSAASPVVNITKSLTMNAVATSGAVTIDGKSLNRGIYIAPAAAARVVIDGLTFSNCYQLNSYGAGIYINTGVAGTAVVQNCTLVTNRCMLTGAPSGGGIASRVTAGIDFFSIVSNCTVVRNYAGTGGGGLYFEYGRFHLEDCLVAHNSVDVWNPFADPYVPAANSRSGGGISIIYPSAGSIIRNCQVESNRASAWGGGIFIRYYGGVLVENCNIRDNIAPLGAGVLITQISSDQTNFLRNCLISRNMAITNNITSYEAGNPMGGGVQLGANGLGLSSNVMVENCTIVSNYASANGGGANLRSDSTKGTVFQNTIIYFNQTTTTPAGSNLSGTVTFSNCLIGTGAVLPGGGNIRSNPEFSDWPALDCRLSSISPCVNAGVNQPWMNGGVDLDNKVRIDRFLGIVDIGCYESTPRGMLVRIR